MNISPENREKIKRAIISVLIGAVISLITQFLQIFLDLFRDQLFDLVGSAGGMLYYLRSRKTA